jgi:hypothetical protein
MWYRQHSGSLGAEDFGEVLAVYLFGNEPPNIGCYELHFEFSKPRAKARI